MCVLNASLSLKYLSQCSRLEAKVNGDPSTGHMEMHMTPLLLAPQAFKCPSKKAAIKIWEK